MKKILLLSDTHSYIDERIVKYATEADEIWHAGDIGDMKVAQQLEKIKPFRAVHGNIDTKDHYPLNNIFVVEGVKVVITHIGGYPGKYTSRVKNLLKQESPKLYICGHSHILKVMHDKTLKILHMNPGAAGNSGFHQMRTMLRFQVENGKIDNLEVIELGKRG